MSAIQFKIEKKIPGKLGRAGVITTPHGVIQTPAFVTVGTKATVKALTPEQVASLGAQVVLANTYHLYLQPGDEVVRDAGGLHKFMNWNGPIMTDSGGFQVFSLGVAFGTGIGKFINSETPNQDMKEILEKAYDENSELAVAKLAKVDNDGVTFKSSVDGSTHRFTPEKSMEIQHNLGADIIFAFDECTSPHAPKEYLKLAMDRTHAWAKRCIDFHHSTGKDAMQGLFGIVQGGRHQDLREESARVIGNMDFAGFGIGGSFVKEDMGNAVNWVNTLLPEDRPRHLLGVGEPIDLFLGIENGIDTFDCVAPTRMARNGGLYTKTGKINITNAQFVRDFTPIDNDCNCYTCLHYTKAYLHHLFKAKEMLAATLASIHNLHFIISLVDNIRVAILNDSFLEFKEEFLGKYIQN